MILIIIKASVWSSNSYNWPFPSSLVPLLQNESKCETFYMKMNSACSFIFMQIKVIFIRMVSHLDALWNRDIRELGNGLFFHYYFYLQYAIISYKITPLQHRPLLTITKQLNITELVRMQGNSQDYSYDYIRRCLFLNWFYFRCFILIDIF